jgi:hypothetical protein
VEGAQIVAISLQNVVFMIAHKINVYATELFSGGFLTVVDFLIVMSS